MRELWIFGYGSLMWRPEFEYTSCQPALLRGAHRALCVYSWVHRGTQQKPGLVLGLDHGGSCRGMAFCVSPKNRSHVIEYLRAREQVTMVYREAWRPIHIGARGNLRVEALCFLVDRRHQQYSGVLSLHEQARLIRQGRGRSGANRDYVLNTVDHLKSLKLHDSGLFALANLI